MHYLLVTKAVKHSTIINPITIYEMYKNEYSKDDSLVKILKRSVFIAPITIIMGLLILVVGKGQ